LDDLNYVVGNKIRFNVLFIFMKYISTRLTLFIFPSAGFPRRFFLCSKLPIILAGSPATVAVHFNLKAL
jgi:hypothetical protein